MQLDNNVQNNKSEITQEQKSFQEIRNLYEALGEGPSYFNAFDQFDSRYSAVESEVNLSSDPEEVISDPKYSSLRDRYVAIVTEVEDLERELKSITGPFAKNIDEQSVAKEYDMSLDKAHEAINILKRNLEDLRTNYGHELSLEDVHITRVRSPDAKAAYLEQCRQIISQMKGIKTVYPKATDQTNNDCVTHYVELERRLAAIEEAIGWGTVSYHSDANRNPLSLYHPDINTAIKDLATRLIFLDNSSLDFLTKRVTTLSMALQNFQNNFNTTSIVTTKDGTVRLSAHNLMIINELYDTMNRWSDQGALLDTLVRRLETLKSIHSRSFHITTEIADNDAAIYKLESTVEMLAKKADEVHQMVEARIKNGD